MGKIFQLFKEFMDLLMLENTKFYVHHVRVIRLHHENINP